MLDVTARKASQLAVGAEGTGLMSDCCMGTRKVPQVQILLMAWLRGRIPFQAYRYTMSYGKDAGIMRDNGVVVGLGAWVCMLMEAILSNSVHESPPITLLVIPKRCTSD